MRHSRFKPCFAFVAVFFFSQFAAAEPSLPRSSPEAQGVSSEALIAFLEAANEQIDEMHSFMLVRNGHVIAEAWWKPYDAQSPHVLYSLSKSFTSTAVGMAIVEGKLSLDDEVLKFFPDEAPPDPSQNLGSMRVRDLLCMSTGHQTEPALFRRDPASTEANDSWPKRFLAHPVPFKPGTHFLYNTAATFMQSAIVQKVSGETTLDYLRPRLFDPLGFKEPNWIASPQGVTVGGFGLSARTEEIAALGELYRQKGMWRGQRLLPETWVEMATSKQTSNGSNPASDWDQGYGFQFWRSRNRAYRGDGAFGQYCLVIPQAEAVIAITSGVRDMQQTLDLVWDKLLPALPLDRASLPENEAAHGRLVERASQLALRTPQGEATSPIADKVSGKRFEFASNDLGLESVAIDFKSSPPQLVVKNADGESRIEVGIGSWPEPQRAASIVVHRGALGVPSDSPLSASGAWSDEDTFTVKLVLQETPFNSRFDFHFISGGDGDRLALDMEHHVAFGPTKLPRLEGAAVK